MKPVPSLKIFGVITYLTVAIVLGPGPAHSQSATETNLPAPFVLAQAPSQWLMTQFRGMDVITSHGEKIGHVADILFDQNGKIVAYIMSVGGFLGVGSKSVAVTPGVFEFVAYPHAMRLRTAMTKEQFKAAEEFKIFSK